MISTPFCLPLGIPVVPDMVLHEAGTIRQVWGHCDGDTKHSSHPQGSQLGAGSQRRKAEVGTVQTAEYRDWGWGPVEAFPSACMAEKGPPLLQDLGASEGATG